MSVNWMNWSHPEICQMLHTSVDPGNIGDGVGAWRDQNKNTENALTGLAPDLNRIVAGGWRGGAADRAINALGPIDQWSVGVAETTERIAALMDAAGSSAAQAKAAVPPPKSFDWGEFGRSFTTSGLVGAVDDAVVQERAQSEAHAEAVRIMTNVYSAPINDYSAAVPTYPQLVDPTLQQPDQVLGPWPAPAPGYPGGRLPGGGVNTHGGAGTHGGSSTYGGVNTHGGGVPGVGATTDGGGRVAHPPPVPVGLQNVTSDRAGLPAHGGQEAPDQGTRQPQHVAGEVAAATLAAAAAGVPMMAPIAGGDLRRARTAAGGHPGASGYTSVHASADHLGEFGPRPTSPTAEIAHSSGSSGSNVSGREAGRAGLGEMMAPMGGGRGPGGEDSEHRRPSYLIEMNDVFTDGRKVAPAVIGEDLPEQDD
ncbi:MAG: WXG100 family type VII secretion target [Pseudonocardiaceae bacterium]